MCIPFPRVGPTHVNRPVTLLEQAFTPSLSSISLIPSQSSSKQDTTKRLTTDQVRLLERSFDSHEKLDPDRKLQLAAELGVPARQVAIWYQNRRARWRTQTIEPDCSALKLELDGTLAQKRRLERDVALLRQELDKAREMLDAARGYGRDRGEGGNGAVPEVPMSCVFNEDDVNWCDRDDGKKVLRMATATTSTPVGC